MRIVVKVGTSTLAHGTGRLNIRRVEKLCEVLADLLNAGHELVLVSSGAIGMGMGKLSLKERPTDLPGKQAAAAVGQCELMYTYDRLFEVYSRVVAQILLTGEDLRDEKRRANFRNTVFRLIGLSVLPIINENDTVVADEIVIGDNDTLGAIVAVNTDADLLVVLSDIEGLYDCDPRANPQAKRIAVVEAITPEIEALAGKPGSMLGTGGMVTKIHAAKIVTEQGIDMVLANGARPEVLYDIVEGKPVGTLFKGRKQA